MEEYINPAKHRRGCLCCHGGHGRPCHPHPKHQHKEQIQHDVQEAAENQKHQRSAAVAHGAEDGVKHIVANGGQDAAAYDADIAVGHFKNSLRRIQECHQRPQENHGRSGKHQAHSQIQYHHACDGLPQLFVVMGPKALGDHNAIAAVESIGKIDEQ